MIGEFCADYSFLSFCAAPPATGDGAAQKPIWESLTENEKQILLRLLERQQELKGKEQELNRREDQLNALREDVQRQIAQLERLQAQNPTGY